MKLFFVRHATTQWNLSDRSQGRTDIELCSQGIKEAESLAKLLSGLKINRVISSDLKRARKTAEIIVDRIKAPIWLDAGLRECSYGEAEGLTPREVALKYGPDIVSMWRGEDGYLTYDFRSLGGVSCNQVLTRHKRVIEDIYIKHPEETVLLVGHARGLKTLLVDLGHKPVIDKGKYIKVEIK